MSDDLTPAADLIRRLEEADEGSRALSDEVLLWAGWKIVNKRRGSRWKAPDGKKYNWFEYPNPTCLLDDIPKAMPWANIETVGKQYLASTPRRWMARQGEECVWAQTEALARCIAVMKGDPR